MFKKIVLGLVLLFGLSVQCQSKKVEPSFETKVKNYVRWFESLPDYKKQQAASELILKLNRMSAYERGMWLAISSKYSKEKSVPVVKKVLGDSLTNEEVKKRLFSSLKKEFVEKGEKLDTIVILSSSTGKERTFKNNDSIREEITYLKDVIVKGNKYMDSIGGTVDEHYQDGNEEFMDSYHNVANAKDQIPRLRNKLIMYQGVGDINWDSYLIDLYKVEMQLTVPHRLTDDELDSGISSGVKFDKKKRIYNAMFIRGYDFYRDNIRDDKKSNFNIVYQTEFYVE